VTTPDLEFICQQHESFLNDLEDLAVETICASPKGRRLGRSQQRFAIAKNDWTAFSAHLINFQNEHDHHGESGIAITEKFYRVQLLDTYKRIEASTKDLMVSDSTSKHRHPLKRSCRTVLMKTETAGGCGS
jgi:hypothetical protein